MHNQAAVNFAALSAANHTFDPSIFREYDIRGVVGDTLFEQDAYLIGRAFASQSEHGKIAVGCDGRLSSPMLHEAVCRGIIDAGGDIIDIGLGPTPMLYFAAHRLKTDGGIMVTGSHNPPDHNGFKFIWHNRSFYGAALQSLRDRAEHGYFANGNGSRTWCDLRQAYLAGLISAYDGGPLNIVWDAGNGAAGDIMARLCQRLPGKHLALNATIDGHFPTHHPDPTVPENLMQLINEVKRGGFDAGVAFDGDGDRIGVVDDEGEILWGDQLLMLYAREILAEHAGAPILADVKASGALFEEIARLGGRPVMWKTGHSLIKAKMVETGALLAGEMSGHIFFADKYYGFDDALYAAVRLLSLLSHSGKKLSELRRSLPQRVNTPEIRFNCDELRKFDVIDEVKARLLGDGATFDDIDGVRVTTPDGWWLLRASNTQPMLVARCEALGADGLSRLQSDLHRQLGLSRVHLP